MIRCITSLAAVLQSLLTADANDLAQATGLVRRRRHLSGDVLAQTLILGWLADPDATLEQLADTAARAGHDVSPQAIDQRLTDQAVPFFEGLLGCALGYCCQACPDATPLVDRFAGVFVFDTTRVRLSDSLAELLPGQGGSTAADGRACAALQVCLELSGQGTADVQLQSGRTHDLAFELAHTGLPARALRLADRGFWSLELFARYDQEGVYWLSRLPTTLLVADESGNQAKIAEYLQTCQEPHVDRPVFLGAQQQPARLVAVRVSEEAAASRRHHLRRQRNKKGKAVSCAALALCSWDVTVTNVPGCLLSVDEVMVLKRLRWQIELLFKTWKSVGGLARTRGQRRTRVLVELYAKLIGQLIQGWHLLAGGLSLLRWSWYRCGKVLRWWWGLVITEVGDVERLMRRLVQMWRRLRRLKKRRRRKQPAAFETIEDPTRAHHAQQGAWALS